MKRLFLSLIIGVVTADDLAAQACSFGPGEMFGVVAYQCANCGFKREKPDRPTYLFYAEPVVLEAKSPGVFRVGDIVEAVDGKPIITSGGAEAFTYPTVGDHEVTVRRGRTRLGLRMSISATGCEVTTAPGNLLQFQLSVADIEAIEVLKGPAAVAQYGARAAAGGVVMITTRPRSAGSISSANPDSVRARARAILGSTPGPLSGNYPMIIVDGVQVSSSNEAGMPLGDQIGRFGFAVECKPSCTAATTKEGTLHYTYYRYDAFPLVAAIRPGSAAERAGLKVGDLVTKVDGHSIGEEEGARILSKLDRQDKLSLTVLRGGKELVIKIGP
jgi:TonB-dependent SusC/RagA subfamily outer membrane receptor